MKKRDIKALKRTLHYLKLVHKNNEIYQYPIREAIEYAIEVLTDYKDAISG